MNNVVIMGRLTREPEIRYLQGSNQAVTRFTVAVDKQLSQEKKREFESQNKPTADFINCVAWGKQAEFIAKHLDKGKRALVMGSIQTGSYEAEHGRVYTTDINVREIEVIDWKNDNSSGGFDDSDFIPTTDDRVPF